MGLTLAQKLIKSHLVEGEMIPGQEIGLKIDQTLTQDATGTMAYLEFEAMGVDRVKTERSVAYIDHNTLQTGFENADDHRYIQTVTKKHGIYFSRPGNGICHQVHLERFGIPGKTLIGSDSHTPTGGGIGMLAMGAGGMDVAVAMGGGTYYIPMPTMTRINLTGYLKPWVSAKDVILEVLRRMTVKGGVGKIIEYGGEGVKTLSVPERATITNMGAELGATTSIFPSDEITLAFLKAQDRADDWTEILPDPDAQYDEVIDIDLCALEPMAACPHMPDKVKTTEEIGGAWEVDYPAWNDIFDAFCHVLTQMDAETADSVLLDEMVYLIARDNEAEGFIQETTSHPQWFERLCRRAAASNESEAKWQFAAYLPECSCSQEVRDIILDFAKDPNEYVSRRALLAMPALRPDCVEQFAPLFWERNCYPLELQEYQRIAVLVSLDAIHSGLLPQYLEQAKQDGRRYLLEHAERIEGGLL